MSQGYWHHFLHLPHSPIWAPPSYLLQPHLPLEAEGGEVIGRNGEAVGLEARDRRHPILALRKGNGVRVAEWS